MTLSTGLLPRRVVSFVPLLGMLSSRVDMIFRNREEREGWVLRLGESDG